MPRHQTLTLRELRPAPPFWLAACEAALAPGAGQYLLVDFGGPLREAVFPAQLTAEGFLCAVPVGHPLARSLPGASFPAYGPLGRGFRLDEVTRLLLVAEATSWPLVQPLFTAGAEVVLVLEALTRTQLPSMTQLPPNVEVMVLTRDGSLGQMGYLEQSDSPLRELVRWAERVALACDPERYPALAALVREVRLHPLPDFAQALVQGPMPCGMGVCDVCRITIQGRERLSCVEGPVFDLLEWG